MFVARVRQEYEGRVLLGTSTCMDVSVEQKEAVTEELSSVLTQTTGSACTAEVWLVASHYQYWPCSPNKAPVQLHGDFWLTAYCRSHQQQVFCLFLAISSHSFQRLKKRNFF